jgi:putative ABC transport system permease protein
MGGRDRELLRPAFGRILRLYPEAFRRLFADDMTSLFERRSKDALDEHGRLGLYRFAVATFAGMAAMAMVEQWDVHRRTRRRHVGIRIQGGGRRSRDRGRITMGIIRDLRSAFRTLVKSKAFTLIAVSTLALGIGVNTTIFSVVNALLFSELPVTEADRFVFLWATNERAGENRTALSFPEVADLRASVQSFEGISVGYEDNFILTGEREPSRVSGFRVSDNMFPLWGVRTILGRSFEKGEDRPGAAPVAVLSDGFWKRHFGEDPRVVGSTIRLDGEAYTVVGVLSPKMEFGDLSAIDVWVPLRMDLATTRRDDRRAFTQARLKPGVSVEEASEECRTVAARLEREHPESEGWSFRVSPVSQEIMNDDDNAMMWALIVSVAFVLWIACVNVANMLMARSTARTREVALRLALGSGRFRLVRQFLTEGFLLSIAACGLGLLLSRGLLELFFVTSDQNWIYSKAVVDSRVLLFTLGISFLTPFLFALLPSLRASRPNLIESLKEGGRAGAGRTTLRSRGLLMAGQVAMALMLMLVTGLLIRSEIELKTANLGFEPQGVLSVGLDLPRTQYLSDDQVRNFYRELVERSLATPGVAEAAVVDPVPLSERGGRRNLRIQGLSTAESHESPSAYFFTVSPGYLSTMKIPLLRGRDFGEGDREGAPRVALINREAAERLFEGEDPLGRLIQPAGTSESEWFEIVGVTGNVAHLDRKVPVVPQVYLPFAQGPSAAMSLVVRTAGAPESVVEPIRNVVKALDPQLPVDEILTMEERRHREFANVDAIVLMFFVFAAFALVMASMGIYGVMSYAVSQREREIGIRMALGAKRSDVVHMIVSEGGKRVVLGTVAGLAGALALGRLLSGILFGVSPFDPLTFVTVTLVLVVVAFLANYVPARRATRIDPIRTLRAE